MVDRGDSRAAAGGWNSGWLAGWPAGSRKGLGGEGHRWSEEGET